MDPIYLSEADKRFGSKVRGREKKTWECYGFAFYATVCFSICIFSIGTPHIGNSWEHYPAHPPVPFLPSILFPWCSPSSMWSQTLKLWSRRDCWMNWQTDDVSFLVRTEQRCDGGGQFSIRFTSIPTHTARKDSFQIVSPWRSKTLQMQSSLPSPHTPTHRCRHTTCVPCLPAGCGYCISVSGSSSSDGPVIGR